VKRQFVQRRALHKVKDPAGVDADALENQLFGGPFTDCNLQGSERVAAERSSACRRARGRRALRSLGYDYFRGTREAPRRRAVQGAEEARLHAAGPGSHRGKEWLSGAFPGTPAPARRIQADRCRTDLVGALDEANYCIWCHEQGKDSCSKGLKEKPPADGFRKTVFGVALAGCPLEQKISEFHMVKARGEPLAALASSPSTTRCWPPPATASATTA